MDEAETGVIDLKEVLRLTAIATQSPCLVVIAGVQSGRVFNLADGESIIGRTQDADVRITEEGVSRRHAKLVTTTTGQLELVDLGSRNGTYCNGERVSKRLLDEGDKIQVGATILKFGYQDDLEQDFLQRQYESVTRDALTGCHNRKSFDERLPNELAFAVRHQRAVSLIMLDIDHFKSINDTYGHPGGDAVLQQFGQLLIAGTREEDVVSRYGGEEFAIILRESARDGAFLLAERLRVAIEARPFRFNGTTIPVTASLGVATWGGTSTPDPERLVKTADDALYDAKTQGRNRVVATEPI